MVQVSLFYLFGIKKATKSTYRRLRHVALLLTRYLGSDSLSYSRHRRIICSQGGKSWTIVKA